MNDLQNVFMSELKKKNLVVQFRIFSDDIKAKDEFFSKSTGRATWCNVTQRL